MRTGDNELSQSRKERQKGITAKIRNNRRRHGLNDVRQLHNSNSSDNKDKAMF
jgi:hypothetical protein